MRSETLTIDSDAEEEGQEAAPRERLEGLDLDALFTPDLETTSINFTVNDRPAEVVLRALGQNDLQSYVTKQGMLVAMMEKNPTKAIDELQALTMDMVCKTLETGTFWHRVRSKGGALGDWQQMTLPETPGQRLPWMKKTFENATQRFWRVLVYECLRVNGLTEDSEKN